MKISRRLVLQKQSFLKGRLYAAHFSFNGIYFFQNILPRVKFSNIQKKSGPLSIWFWHTSHTEMSRNISLYQGEQVWCLFTVQSHFMCSFISSLLGCHHFFLSANFLSGHSDLVLEIKEKFSFVVGQQEVFCSKIRNLVDR